MPRTILALTIFLFATTARAQEAAWPPEKQKDTEFTGRKLDTYQHGVKKEWGYAAPQRDTFLVLHPKERRAWVAPLYVVLHSAGHDVHSCLACTKTVGNHDIYHAPPDFFALYLDCRANKGDWWWGINKYQEPDVSPTDKRVIDTVKWVIQKYGIDTNRVYLSGNSMGGSGTLGIGMRHGDVFAAIKANVPAEVKHVSARMYLSAKVPADVKLPDPPITIDYSAQNDGWSRGHDAFVKAMSDRKYPLILYWGPFGHANNHANIKKVNYLFDTFDWLSVKKNEAYPVFTNASTDDPLPWPDKLGDKKSGQINAFFRWKNVRDTPDTVETKLVLMKQPEWHEFWMTDQPSSPDKKQIRVDGDSKRNTPTESTADVTLRRLQEFRVEPGTTVRWTFGKSSGEVRADTSGIITIPRLKISTEPSSLTITKAK